MPTAIDPEVSSALSALERQLLGTQTSSSNTTLSREDLIAEARKRLAPFSRIDIYGTTHPLTIVPADGGVPEKLPSQNLSVVAGPVSHGSAIGALHVLNPVPEARVCQDRTAVVESGSLRAGAGCDGVSGAAYSHLGADLVAPLAAREALRFMAEQPEADLGAPETLLELHARIVGSAQWLLRSRSGLFEHPNLPSCMATTLLLLLDNGRQITACGLGSGSVVFGAHQRTCSDLIGRARFDAVSSEFARRPAIVNRSFMLANDRLPAALQANDLTLFREIALTQKIPEAARWRARIDELRGEAHLMVDLLAGRPVTGQMLEDQVTQYLVASAQDALLQMESLRFHTFAIGRTSDVLAQGPAAIVSDGVNYLAKEGDPNPVTLTLGNLLPLNGAQVEAAVTDYHQVTLCRPLPAEPQAVALPLDEQAAQFRENFRARLLLKIRLSGLRRVLEGLDDQVSRIHPSKVLVSSLGRGIAKLPINHELMDALRGTLPEQGRAREKIRDFRRTLASFRALLHQPREFSTPGSGGDIASVLHPLASCPPLAPWLRLPFLELAARDRLAKQGISLGVGSGDPLWDDISFVAFRS